MSTRLVALAALALAGPAVAQTTSMRTFVSGLGTDTGTCARSAPCRSFQYAYGITPAGGEVVALDPAGYGTLSINHAISIIGLPNGGAAITVPSGGTGIAIAAGTGDTVILRGIAIDGAGDSTSTGITITAGSLVIAESKVTNVANGIVKNGAGSALVTRTTIQGGSIGVTSNAGNTTLGDVSVLATGANGVLLTGGTLQVTHCTIADGNNGINERAGTVFVRYTTISGNSNVGLGQSLSASAVAYLDHTTITANVVGVSSVGSLYSYGNNNIAGNNTNVNTGPIATIAPN